MAYSIINPWRYGIGSDNVAKTLGYRWQQDDDSPGGWFRQSQNDEGGMIWSRVRNNSEDNNDNVIPDFSDAFDPVEAQRQSDFRSKFVPALQKGRSDIWNAYLGGYGSEQEAIKNLYLDLGEYGGGKNLLVKDSYDGNDASFYDPTNRRLTKFLGGPADLFKQAASDPKHFGIVGGPGYLPYSWDDVSADPSNLASLGLFLDDQGKPIIGGVRSTPNNNSQFLANFATMMPITLGTAFMGGALGGAFPGIDVGTGAAMEAGTTGLSISNALGLKDLPSWFTSGLDKLGNNLLTQGVQGKNPLDNPIGLVTPFLKGLNFGSFGGDAISGATQVASSVPDSYWNMTANAGNTLTDAGGSMGDWWNDPSTWVTDNILDIGSGAGGGGSMLDFWNSPSGGNNGVDWWTGIGSYGGTGTDLGWGTGANGATASSSDEWWKKLMPSGDSLLKLGMLGLGGALGGVNGSKQAGTTTTTQTQSNVPDWALPYVQGSLARGAGINATQGYNGVPTDLANLAAGQLGKTIKGDYLSLMNNPQWLDLSQAMGDAYKYGTAPSRASQFERANALGSTAYAQQKGIDDQAFGRSLAGLAGQIYGQERTNQERASTIAPDWSRSYQQVPYGNEQAYQGLLRGWGGTGTNSSPYYTNPYAGILGGMSAVGSLFGKNGVF